MTSSGGYEPPMKLIELLDEFLGEARHTQVIGDEVFAHCRACGDVDGHASWCPVPAITRYMERTP